MYPVEHYYLSFGGTIAGVEEWSMGLRLSAALVTNDQLTEATALVGLSDVLKAQWALTSNPCRNDVILSWVKYNRIGVDGKYAKPYTNVLDLAPAVASGSSSATPMPLQIALVVTLETGFTRGLAHRGRIYLPGPKWPVTAPGMVLASAALDLTRDWVVSTLQAINAETNSGKLCVYSGVREGAVREITSVSIGNYYDTMRSRRGQVVEQRTVGTIPDTGGGGPF